MSTSSVPRIFVSATTRDLESYRDATAEVLLELNAYPVIQQHFAPDHRTVAEMLRDRISKCGAVICLVGQSYGSEPTRRDPSQPRRSYTQLEYEIAVELEKPVYVFVATNNCKFDTDVAEPEEFRALQREHLDRINASDRVRMPFNSVEHLTNQIRIMDLNLLADGRTTRLVVLLFAELIDTDSSQAAGDDQVFVRDVIQPFRTLLRGNAGALRWHTQG